jgi:hypothetical protein
MTTSARELAKRRSALRWRMSYLGLTVLGLMAARASCSALFGGPRRSAWLSAGGRRIIRLYQDPMVDAYRWTVGALVVAMLLVGVQLYFVGGRSTPARSRPVRCPECGGRLRRHTIRVGKAAGQAFWSCENHPGCGYSRRAPAKR